MACDTGLAVERAMPIQEVAMRAVTGQIQWFQAVLESECGARGELALDERSTELTEGR